jgi:hypothetical protein
MPGLNPNEKRLLLILGAAVFLIANGFGGWLIYDSMGRQSVERARIESRIRELENAKADAAEAQEKGDWIEANLKAYVDEPQRETYLNDVVFGEMTSGLNVELKDSAPMSTLTDGRFFIRSRFRTKVLGPWQDVKQFIYRLQKPEDFRFVPRLTMVPRKNEEDDSRQYVEVYVEIEKWWPRPDGFGEEMTEIPADSEQPAAPGVESPATTPAAPADAAPAQTPPSSETTPAGNPATTTDPPPAPDTPPATPETPQP